MLLFVFDYVIINHLCLNQRNYSIFAAYFFVLLYFQEKLLRDELSVKDRRLESYHSKIVMVDEITRSLDYWRSAAKDVAALSIHLCASANDCNCNFHFLSEVVIIVKLNFKCIGLYSPLESRFSSIVIVFHWFCISLFHVNYCQNRSESDNCVAL